MAMASMMLASPAWAKGKLPATEAAQKVLTAIELVEQKLTKTRYQHKTVVNLGKGLFYWDCSGMSGWVLGRAAPVARKQLPPKHPLASQFYNRIDKSPTGEFKKGWSRVDGIENVAPGDIFAWLKPEWWVGNKNTGHVGFVIEAPRPSEDHKDVWLVRIADASQYRHENDSRPPDGEGGFGTGTIAFSVGPDGNGTGYGWFGSLQDPLSYIPTRIIFGRVRK
jgi:hypothetical protein